MKFKDKPIVQVPANDPTTISENSVIAKNKNGNLSYRMVELLIRQLKHELYNMNLYRTFANFYGTKGYAVLEKYYIERSEEEKAHHNWIEAFLRETDARIKYPEIPAIEEEWGEDMIKPFKLTVEAEIKTTQLIDEMIDQAMTEKDWGTYMWLLSDDDEWGRLRREQIEEESISRTALDIAESDSSWNTKEKAIMKAYKGDDD